MFSSTEDFPDDWEPTTTWSCQYPTHWDNLLWGQTYNLRQVQRIISNSVEDQVLEPVYNAEQLITERGHVEGWGAPMRVVFFS